MDPAAPCCAPKVAPVDTIEELACISSSAPEEGSWVWLTSERRAPIPYNKFPDKMTKLMAIPTAAFLFIINPS
ncbi:MAG TPA: hypothetical protein DCZ95_06445 [Verrucomicrobia bacterium]|nr:MAG: hypothetical protein A2X46_16220 [Lentisphaerae bacterium GWF2_57_35]HBA83717.1 hypothetical protein [Verrucomicrobiota bacterium]